MSALKVKVVILRQQPQESSSSDDDASSWWCSPRHFTARRAEMTRQISREVRPSGRSPIVWNSLYFHLWHYIFHFRPLIQTLGLARLLGFRVPIPRSGSSGTTTTPWCAQICHKLRTKGFIHKSLSTILAT